MMATKSGKSLKSTGSSRLLLLKSAQEKGENLDSERNDNLAPNDYNTPLELTELELREEIVRTLTTFNPEAPKYPVEFCFKTQGFVPRENHSHFIVHLNVESTCLERDSEAAQEQLARMQCSDPIEIKSALAQIGTTGSEEKVEEEEEPEVDGEGGAEEAPAEKHDEPLAEVIEKPPEPVAPVAVPVAISSNPPKKLTNQFNFCERGSLTLNNPSREVSTQTNPPSRITFSASITQWAIYDAYMEDHEQQEMKEKEKKEKEKEKATLAPQKKEQEAKKQEGVQEKSKFTSPEKAAKILERMSNQNTYDEIIQDFKYWEDPSDEFKEEEGTLLPLWKFSCDKAQNYSVTSICWNENCPDIFVAGYGSFDFKRRKAGLMCVYTMKNPSYPEHLVAVKSEVLAVDIHMTCTSLIVLGLSDGNIAVFDLTKSCETPLHTSNSVNNKHSAAVWQVRWSKELSQTEMTIYSISADGQVLSWTLMQNEMIKMKLISLTFSTGMIHSDDSCPLTGCGTALTFHPTENNIFLVGTEEGRIYKCSTAYTSIFLSESEAHYMPVQQVDFNRFNPAVYASCSGDWRVKIWEDNRKEPLFEFDLGSPVEDVAWAPYSSTVLAAATADGRVHVFDLNVNKYRPLCQQVVTQKKKCKLTKVSFNPKHSMLIVGDSFGGVSSVKMSPNLRKKQKPPKKGMIVDHETLEKLKLDKLLSLVREPNKPLMVLETESNAN